MLVTDPEKRISAEDALKHEWMVLNHKEKKINHKSLENLAKFHVSLYIFLRVKVN
jgi:calcium-dependent protein kinase